MKKLVYLIVVIVALGLIIAGCLPTVPPAEQSNADNLTKAVINVPSGGSIQDAIYAAEPGDTITVGPGTYNEAITINKSLTIQSSGTAANTIIDASNAVWPPPYQYAVMITADNVTFQGFTVKYHWLRNMKLGGISLDGVSGCTISDNIGDVGNEGIYLGNSDNNTISGNDFSNNTVNNGIYLYYSDGNEIVGNDVSSLSGFPVSRSKGIKMNMANNNLIYDNTVNSDKDGIWIYQGCSGNKIYENELSSNTRAGIYCEWSAGFGNEIYDNTISGNPVGILWRGSNNEIYGNFITGNSEKGIWLFGSHTHGNEIYDNDITSNTDIGIMLSTSCHDNTIHDNNITGNTNWGVNNLTSNMVDATYNWWGDKRGPSRAMGEALGHDDVKGDRVSPNVKFAPWAKECF